jgi:hypothetical protein
MENTKTKQPPIWKSFQKTPAEKLKLKKTKAECGKVEVKLVAKITQ